MSEASPDAPDLGAKVEFLASPAAHAGSADRVETIETHMAWVFLTERHALKLKKPVRFDFLDYGEPEDRRAACESEVRLNRRLAPDVYLGVERLSITRDGRMTLGPAERTVDWLVKMRRLPRHRMLDQTIERDTVEDGELVALGQQLGRFYGRAEPVDTTWSAQRDRLLTGIEENLTEVSRPEFEMDRESIDLAGAEQRRLVEARSALFRERIEAGRVVEGHGDLRPQHVCLLDPPPVIDCIEFNREFRIVDAVDDLCFLWLECERLGAPEAGRRVLEVYSRVVEDRPPPALTHFYRSVRACLRAKLSLWHLDDESVDPEAHAEWRERAGHYLELAAGHASRIGG